MIKVLGVFIGFGDLNSANWRPRIDSVTKCLASWSIRSLSFSGRALVANALALSRIWYVAALVHMPHWVIRELNTLLFNFFWAGKKDKVSQKVVVQPRDCGGFAVVAIDLKVQALLIQWVKCFAASPSAWVSLLTYWCFDRFGVDPTTLLSTPFNFALRRLPPSMLLCFGPGVPLVALLPLLALPPLVASLVLGFWFPLLLVNPLTRAFLTSHMLFPTVLASFVLSLVTCTGPLRGPNYPLCH